MRLLTSLDVRARPGTLLGSSHQASAADEACLDTVLLGRMNSEWVGEAPILLAGWVDPFRSVTPTRHGGRLSPQADTVTNRFAAPARPLSRAQRHPLRPLSHRAPRPASRDGPARRAGSHSPCR